MLDGYDIAKFKKLINYNSFDLLIKFLENPNETSWQKLMFVVSLLHADPGRV